MSQGAARSHEISGDSIGITDRGSGAVREVGLHSWGRRYVVASPIWSWGATITLPSNWSVPSIPLCNPESLFFTLGIATDALSGSSVSIRSELLWPAVTPVTPVSALVVIL